MSKIKNDAAQVFEKYAHEYDLITNAKQREKPHAEEINSLINRFKPESVMDAGCASGLTASLFARKGVKTVGLDRSRKMIQVARDKYEGEKWPLTFKSGDFTKLPKSLHKQFDMIVCLANSISGVGTVAGLKSSLKNFKSTLKPGGVLVLQLLNIEAVQDNMLMPVRVTRNDSIVYTRFSERRGKSMNLFISRADLSDDSPVLEVFKHESDSFPAEKVKSALESCLYEKIRGYSDLFLSRKQSRSSRDLVFVAHKPL